MASRTTRLLARFVLATSMIDRAAQRFSQLRSTLVLALASDEFLRQYGDAAYSSSTSYRADSKGFREGLFDWESSAIRRYFPAPPAHVLVGGAGGGREPFALLAMGYHVTAFDPATALVSTMKARALARGTSGLHTCSGGYEDLPVLRATDDGGAVDLRASAPFDAAVLGWSSLSHLASDEDRVSALVAMAALTRGPLFVSYFSSNAGAAVAGPAGTGLRGWFRQRVRRRGHAMFTPMIGFARLLSVEEFQGLATRAGLSILFHETESNFPHAILVRASGGSRA